MIYIKIALKSFLRKNLGSKSILLCVGLLILLPSLLYNLSCSVMREIDSSQKDVFGAFSDIVYAPVISANSLDDISEKTAFFLNGFNSSKKGIISTVYSKQLNDSRTLYVGYADEIAHNLGRIHLVLGRFPETSDEIALTEGSIQFFDCELGDKVEILGDRYIITGVVQDYGRLWVRGSEQDGKNIYPVNAFLTKQAAENLLSKTHTLTTQILLTKNTDNMINQVDSTYHFENINIKKTINFVVPPSFLVIDLILSVFVIFFILLLDRKRMQKRISAYYCLGLNDKKILGILCFERMLSSILGIITGFISSTAITEIVLYGFSKNTERVFIFVFDFENLIPFAIIFFVLTLIIVLLFTAYEIDYSLDIMRAEHKIKTKKIKFSKKFSLGMFLLKRNISSYSLLTLLATFSFSLISYGIFYQNYFRSDITEAPDGTLPRDYDFQFTAYPQSAAPWQDKNDPIIFFTDTLEKIGATEDFINQLKYEPMTDKIKAYKENNKYFTLMKPTQIDEYLDGWDFELDGAYASNFGYFNNFTPISDSFGYEKDDVLVQSEILGYPEKVLEQLSGSVIEGSIDIEKIRSGEEVVLRVPAYILKNIDESIMRSPVEYTAANAVNFKTFKVGDEITLTSLWTDEMVNGAVPLSYLDKFERNDITVKIGAIIRSTDGIMYSFREQQALAFLTVNEAFDVLNIPATYSIVSVYANPNYPDNELTNRYTELSKEVPNMEFQNWITDIKTYKIFNLMVNVYVFTFTAILVITTLAVLSSQLLNLTQFSLKAYVLLRINGLKFNKIVLSIFIHSVFVTFIGEIIGIPVSFFLIIYFGIRQDFDIVNTFLYYFPIENFLYVFILLVVIILFAIIPSLITVYKNKNNILDGMNSE